jgi:predicted amidohydrolase YtcJ
MFLMLSVPAPQLPTREMLVRGYTLGSAYAEHAEREKGSIAPGMLADIAVLSQDIFTVQVAELPRTESVLTLVGGRVAWDAGVLR